MEKKYCDKGKYAAPRWLVYPELSTITIGWRMGYGEEYRMNEPPRDKKFNKSFPKPQNWLFENKKFKSPRAVLFGFMWRDYGKPKYSHINKEKIIVNDFITMKDEKKFQMDSHMFKSIQHMLLYSRYCSCTGTHKHDIPMEILKTYEVPNEEKARWNEFKYTVCLNACYYKIMNDEKLKEKLISTGNKSLVYISDDEWGGESNLFGFALMELRDEIHRLYENANLIDWEYTEYLKNAYPYIDHHKNPLEDEQSPEYNVYSSILLGASRYVRDTNLKKDLSEKYKTGQIITEKAFVDASTKIGGMVTSHRYIILSQYFTDLSQFEHGTNWALHTTKNDSKFKVLDIYNIGDKTQILLLQLPDGFEKIFEGRIELEDKIIARERKNFHEDLQKEIFEELATAEWLERCDFPLGMNNEGEFY